MKKTVYKSPWVLCRYVPRAVPFFVEVSYLGYPDSAKDALINKAFSHHTDGSGFSFLEGRRDITKTYRTVRAARNAVTAVHRLRTIRGIRVRISRPRVGTPKQ